MAEYSGAGAKICGKGTGMKEIVIISGKGGTGKTSITGAFAALAGNAVLADCDVDAADLHLLLQPVIRDTHDFSGGKEAKIIQGICTQCGKCAEVCRFDAVKSEADARAAGGSRLRIDPVACEGCGVCAWFCPAGAIQFEEAVNGQWFLSDTRFGPLVHARLGVAQENSGKLVTLVRSQARDVAAERSSEYIIVDGSPGIGCPVIASITGADLVVIVTEPTVSGEHDLTRVAGLARHFGIPVAVCVNKADINPAVTARLRDLCTTQGLFYAGSVPYDKAVTAAQVAGLTVIEYDSGVLSQALRELWGRLTTLMHSDGATPEKRVSTPCAECSQRRERQDK